MEVFESYNGRTACTKPVGDTVTKSTCCCSIGKAWGPLCEVCPERDSEEYKLLCPGGEGFTPDSVSVCIQYEMYS